MHTRARERCPVNIAQNGTSLPSQTRPPPHPRGTAGLAQSTLMRCIVHVARRGRIAQCRVQGAVRYALKPMTAFWGRQARRGGVAAAEHLDRSTVGRGAAGVRNDVELHQIEARVVRHAAALAWCAREKRQVAGLRTHPKPSPPPSPGPRARKESPGSEHIPRLARPVRLCSAAEQPRFDVGASNRAPTCLLSYPSETARNWGSTQDTIQNPGQGEHGTVRLSSLATQNTPKRSWFKNNAVSDGFENACCRAALGPVAHPRRRSRPGCHNAARG